MSQFLPLTLTLPTGDVLFSPMMNARDESFWRDNTEPTPALRRSVRLFNKPGSSKTTQDKVSVQVVIPTVNTTDDQVAIDYTTVNVNFSLNKNAGSNIRSEIIAAVKDLMDEVQVIDLVENGAQPY